MRILVVDDSRAMRLLVTRCLKQAGVGDDIIEAANGVEGLQATRQQHPDLVLTDWNMPEMGGLGLIEAIRGDDNSVRIGVVSSDSGNEMRSQAEAAGASFVISKPFTPQIFDACINNDSTNLAAVTQPDEDALPDVAGVTSAIGGLMPIDVKISSTEPLAIRKAGPLVAAAYGDADSTRIVCICELEAALSMGACMTRFPKGHVDEGVKSGSVTGPVADNVAEFFNVVGSMFRRSTLQGLTLPPEKLPVALKVGAIKSTERVDVKIEIPGYGAGTLAIAFL